MNYNIVSLRSVLEDHSDSEIAQKLSSFTCSKDKDRGDHLHNTAISLEKRDMSRTYLAIDESGDIIGFFTVGMKCMAVPEDVPISNSLKRKLNINPETRVAQMYLLGQLARSDTSEPGLGSSLLDDALDIINWAYLAVGCHVVRIDCTDELVDYYRKHGFTYVNRNENEGLNRMVVLIKS